MYQMRQIAYALHTHHDVHGTFPPAYSVDEQGVPLHSWRTLLLPYLEEQQLAQKINLEEPRSRDANASLLGGRHIKVFQSPREPARNGLPDETNYLAVVDEETVLRPGEHATFRSIRDGTASTIVFVEAVGRGIRWHEPRDLTMEEAIDLLSGEFDEAVEWIEPGYYLSTRYRGDGLRPRLVGWADGHVSPICILDRETARALLTRAGGEEVTEESVKSNCNQKALRIGYVIQWPRILANVIFAALAIAPAFRKRGSRPLAGEA